MSVQTAPAVENEKPDGARCASCRFSFLNQLPPPNIGKILVCKKNPPTPVILVFNGQPSMLPATHPNVPEDFWCYAFENSVPRPKIVS